MADRQNSPRTSSSGSYLPIEDYGIIGNLHTTALVSKAGSIDFLPFTRYDSPTIFTALLDAEKGGSFSFKCVGSETNYKQLYLPDTCILLTRYLTEKGMIEVTDFMPIIENEAACTLFRRVKAVRGDHLFSARCAPRFDYARRGCDFEKTERGFLLHDPDRKHPSLLLATDVPLDLDEAENALTGQWDLSEGETLDFLLTVHDPDRTLPRFETCFEETRHFWQSWIDQSRFKGRWREMVNRSAMTLKLLTSCRYGSTVAAATFGLPEALGGERNWDYRFTWIRDAAFTMYAFLRLGFTQEAEHFMEWIKNRCLGENLQLLYAVDGERELDEQNLDHLEGYQGSKPVRIGNAAHDQSQMDIFGELIDTIYLYNQAGGSITFAFWQRVQDLVEYVIENWRSADHGIWEIRSEEKEFLHSRVCCWVAIDRAMRIADARSLPVDKDRWRKARDEIYRDIYDNFWNEEIGAYVQYRGADRVDASALLIPLLRFLSSKEPRWLRTLSVIEDRLVMDVLVYRYIDGGEGFDGLEGEEGTFSICSFWYIECLARVGRTDEAALAFEKMLGYANHLGLFSEEIALSGRQLGNFPQAFTHLSLISAAYQIDKQEHEKSRKPSRN